LTFSSGNTICCIYGSISIIINDKAPLEFVAGFEDVLTASKSPDEGDITLDDAIELCDYMIDEWNKRKVDLLKLKTEM
jgi:hypothetical protein